jgi:PAS domain S-box-containing protein
MRLNRVFSAWNRERLGLTMIMASLAVIAVTVFLLFFYQQKDEEAHVRDQGTNLARVLSRLPIEQLVPAPNQQSVLAVLKHSYTDTNFAYLAIVDTKGNPLTEISSPGVILPQEPLPSEPTSWLGERQLALGSNGRKIYEFHAPVFDQGRIAGHIRLGYFRPGLGLKTGQIPYIASFALLIFLLTPIFYFLVRREIRPLQRVNSQIDNLVEKAHLSRVEVAATGELCEFMDRFGQFIDSAQNRIQQLETDRSGLVTSTKLIDYKRTRIESVLHSLPDSVMVLDESGCVSLLNTKLAALLGVRPEEVIGKKPLDWCKDHNIIEFLASYAGKSFRSFNSDSIEFSPADSPDKTIVVTTYPLFSPKNSSQLLGTLVLFRDTTAEKVTKQSSAEFIAHVAHELKTPLNIISMYSETLQSETGRTEAFMVEAANVIHDESERVSMLINNILNITKIEMGSMGIERKRVKLRDLLVDAFEACARSGKSENVEFKIDLPKQLSAVAADKDLLRIAINNLLTNAIKYNRPGGTVELSAEESATSVLIHVRDNGVGITEEEQDKIFDKFYRSERDAIRAKSGHGLGLPLAREIILLHHGSLEVTSEPGEGSEFTIVIAKETELLQQAV